MFCQIYFQDSEEYQLDLTNLAGFGLNSIILRKKHVTTCLFRTCAVIFTKQLTELIPLRMMLLNLITSYINKCDHINTA